MEETGKGVSYANAFFDGDFSNKICEGVLTALFLMALQVTVNKIFFRSKKRSVAMMMRREVYQRLTGWREIKDMLTGYDDHKDKERLSNENETKPQIHPKRLIIPVVCHTLLFLTQAIILVLSGQYLEPHGKATMTDYHLQPGEPVNKPKNFCREHLTDERHTRISGSLTTCVKIQTDSKIFTFDEQMGDDGWFLSAYMKCYTNEFWFEIIRNKKTKTIYGSPTSEATALTKVFVEITYSSYDGYTQTLLPFSNGPKVIPNEATLEPLFDTQAAWNETSIHYIYDQLALNLSLSEENTISKFGDLVKFESLYKMEGAKIKLGGDHIDGEGKAIGNALANVILNKMELVQLNDIKMYSFDPRTGLYMEEKGDGPRLYEKNIVAQWIYVVAIIVLSIIAFIVSKIQNEDPEFYLYRAFLEANNMNPKLGPLAQPLDKNNDVFFFGSIKEGGLFARFTQMVNQYYPKRKENISPGTSPSSSKGSESPKEGIFTRLLPEENRQKEKNTTAITNLFPEAKTESCENQKKKDEKDDFVLPMFCGADLGCFKVNS